MLNSPVLSKKERRKYPRSGVKENTMAFMKTTFGEIVNISKGGLYIRCLLHTNDQFDTSFQIGLLSGNADYFLENLPCKVISVKDSSPLQSSRATFIREAGLMFLHLTSKQQTDLDRFLKQNIKSEV
jgi:hypothetical protein